MTDRRDIWSAGEPARGQPAAPSFRPPSGLFPAGPPRPTYREPHPVSVGAVFAGFSAGALWMLLFGVIAGNLRGYAWWTLLAGAAAWAAAAVFARWGDRGVAVGVALSTGVAWSVAFGAVILRWAVTGDWPMW